MENVYRRNNVKERERISEKKHDNSSLKSLILKQSVICMLIFLGAVMIYTSPNSDTEFAKKSIRYILTESTDYAAMPQKLYDFFDKYILNTKAKKKDDRPALKDMKPPIYSVVDSPLGMRTHPTENTEKFHYGVDIRADMGEKIVCAQNGTAHEVSYDDGYGNYIIVEHGDGISTLYAHCSEILANVGDEITKGQTIATVGSSGNTSGAHLHFEIRDGDQWLDPEEFIIFKKE